MFIQLLYHIDVALYNVNSYEKTSRRRRGKLRMHTKMRKSFMLRHYVTGVPSCIVFPLQTVFGPRPTYGP